ncbi:hypothetical protein [Streptomyces sp. E-08]|uniref:hypothetical protein n=1 Tax=Streptomyces sp. E-08 TaxID=3404047 RepID=UPI003CE99C36
MVTAEQDPPQELCLKLRAAADRLLAGTPLHSSGKLTILDLAEEAQVKRWLLTHKYPTTLMAKIAERDEALATRDAALGVTALNPPPQRTASAGRGHRPLPRGRR